MIKQLKIDEIIIHNGSESVDAYLSEISREALVDSQEEIALAEKIHAGDEQALVKIIKANLRFVVTVAKQYRNQGLELPELINAGNLGLIEAAMKFSDRITVKFSTHAILWINLFINEALAEKINWKNIQDNLD